MTDGDFLSPREILCCELVELNYYLEIFLSIVSELGCDSDLFYFLFLIPDEECTLSIESLLAIHSQYNNQKGPFKPEVGVCHSSVGPHLTQTKKWSPH